MNDLRPGAINADPREHGKSVQLCHRLLRSLIARGLSLPALVEAVERIKKDTRLKDTVKDAPKMNTPTDWLNELAATLNESQVKRGRANKEYRVFEDSRDGFLYVAPHGPLRADTIVIAYGPHSGWHFDALTRISKAERRARKAAAK